MWPVRPPPLLILLWSILKVALWDSVSGRRHSPESCPSSITYCCVTLGWWLNLSEPHLSAGNGKTFFVGFGED